MGLFGVVDNNLIVNIIVADSKEIAENVTQKICVEYTEENSLGIGYYWSEEWNKYIQPSEYPSWQYNGDAWESPVPYPNDGEEYVWDEPSTSWLLLPPSN